MKIIYKNYRGKNYEIFRGKVNSFKDQLIIGFRHKQTNELVEIPIYDSESDTLPIYTELITLDSVEFANKYGVLVSPSLVPTYDIDTHNYLLSEPLKCITNSINDEKHYECIFYKVHVYYKSLMKHLVAINQLLKRPLKDNISLLHSLSCECYAIAIPPYFDAVFGTQYVDPFDSKYNEYFKVNPYAHIIYSANKAILSKAAEWQLNFSSCFKDPKMGHVFNTIFRTYHYHREIDDSYLIKNQKQIVNLAKFLFSNALSNEIRDIYPIVNYDQSVLLNEWYFPTLASALFYSLYLDYSSSLMIAYCSNEYCKNIYSYRKTGKPRKYCCPKCGHNVAARQYIEKLKKSSKEKKMQDEREKTPKSEI